jgi:MFS family permease
MQRRFGGLWRHSDFLKLWAGQTVSLTGSAITSLALPLAAVLVFQATPAQMGLLTATDLAPWLVVGLFAGVWVDRLPRRPVMIIADLGRAVLLGSVPVAALLGLLRLEQLYVVAFLAGILTVFFNSANPALLPTLVGRPQLIEGNSKMMMSASITQIAGPGLAGWLVQVLSAPLAIILDAISFLVSASFLTLIRATEPLPTSSGQRRRMWREIAEGIEAIIRQPLVRPIIAASIVRGLFTAVVSATYLIYVARNLGLAPGVIGVLLAVSGPATLLGSVVTQWLVEHVGRGPTLIVSPIVTGIGILLVPLAGGPFLLLTLAVGQVLVALSNTIFYIAGTSLTQSTTPDHLQGRVGASARVFVLGIRPIGALVGGAMGQAIGLQPTLVLAGIGMTLACLVLLLSAVRALVPPPSPRVETA